MKNVDIHQLDLLCRLIDLQSLGAAAERLNMTSSAASQSLARLRAAFTEDLYVRQGGGYALTPYGERVIDGLRSIVRRWGEVEEAAQRFDPAQCELSFSVACLAHFATAQLARLHREIREQAPRARLEMSVPSLNVTDVQALRSGKLDVLCTHMAPSPDTRDLHHELLITCRYSEVVLRRDHPRIGASLSLQAFLGEEHLVGEYRNSDRSTRSPIDNALAEMGLPPRRSIFVQSLWACLDMVSRGDHLITLVPTGASFLTDMVPQLRRLPLPSELQPVETKLYMLWHERTHRSRAHQWFRESVRRVIQSMEGK